MERRALEADRASEPGEPHGTGLAFDAHFVIEILKHLLRRAQRLLENIVDSYQPLQRLEQQQERRQEAHEIAGAHGVAARVSQQRDDGRERDQVDHRRRDRLLQNVSDVGLEQPARRLTEFARLVRFGAERFHHHVPAQRLLQNLVELRLTVLRATAGAADAPADPRDRKHHHRQNRQADCRQLPIDREQDEEQPHRAEKLPEEIRQNLRRRHPCTLSISFMIDDIRCPVEFDSKNSAPCRSTFSKTHCADPSPMRNRRS